MSNFEPFLLQVINKAKRGKDYQYIKNQSRNSLEQLYNNITITLIKSINRTVRFLDSLARMLYGDLVILILVPIAQTQRNAAV